jgi:DNA-binding response OmpR family regulator
MNAPSVLIGDRNADARREIAELLAKQGYVAITTGSGADAVAKLKQRLFDCAIVDVELEDMPGLDSIPRLRAVDPHLPIIVSAARNSKQLEARVRQENAVYYYVKSFNLAELAQAVSRAVLAMKRVPRARILIVDDDDDYQAAVRLILEGAGYKVFSAYTKEDGLAALKREAPNLVILDIMMTKTTDGFHFLYEMKADPAVAARKPPVLSVSCISKALGMSFSPTTDGEYFPADDFLAKPVSPGELLAHVRALLAGYRLGDTLRPGTATCRAVAGRVSPES